MKLSKTGRFRILARDRFTCRYCGRCAPEVVLEVDHVHPRSEGGSNDEDNLVSACHDCNSGKGATLLPVPEDVVVLVDGSVPHPDACPECAGLRSYLAESEAPEGPHGYRAHYRCDHGHTWSTWWPTTVRHSRFGAEVAVAEFNAEMKAYA